MELGQSLLRVKIPREILSKLKIGRKDFNSDNAYCKALGINIRTYKIVFEDKQCRTDVLDKIKKYLKIK